MLVQQRVALVLALLCRASTEIAGLARKFTALMALFPPHAVLALSSFVIG
jgi:ABC-type proline/glycine betaine transport system permease subunit